MRSITAEERSRNSTTISASCGTTFGAPGFTETTPMLQTESGEPAASKVSRAATAKACIAAPASRRIAIGVVPA